MNDISSGLIYSEDEAWSKRIVSMLSSFVSLTQTAGVDDLHFHLEALNPCLLFVDLRTNDVIEEVEYVLRKWPRSVLICFGSPGSQPMKQAENLDVFATEEPRPPRSRLQTLTRRAVKHLDLIKENQRLLEQEDTPASKAFDVDVRNSGDHGQGNFDLRYFSRAARDFTDLDQMLYRIIEGVESSIKVSRVGLFAWDAKSQIFSIRAGVRCMEACRRLEFTNRHPLVKFFELHMHIVSRQNLGLIEDTRSREMLQQLLKLLGAEIIIPLFAQGNIIGWIFLGQRITGQLYTRADLEDLAVIAEHISTIMDNAMLYQEASIQRTLATTLLHSIPNGIIAVDTDGIVRWFNEAAENILDQQTEDIIDQKVEKLGSQFSDLLHTALESEAPMIHRQMDEYRTQKFLDAQCRRLVSNGSCLGAVALIQDKTQERIMQAREKRLERSAFWTDLAAAMSHEIRNPLVTIKTFAQLLPERYDDDEFREEFSSKVNAEADRLNAIVDQINNFANPPDLNFMPLNPEKIINRCAAAVFRDGPDSDRLDIHIDPGLPMIYGDEAALTDCLTQLLQNASEAVAKKKNGRIRIQASADATAAGKSCVSISIADNGNGIPEDIRSKLFSPFCTTKARGMGLGLPISQRTVADHEGSIDIETGTKGTTVTVKLPSQKVEAAR